MIDNTKEYILCAAWKRKEPKKVEGNPYHVPNDILNIELGYRHHDIYMRFGEELINSNSAMGFYTSHGRFVSRTEAMEIAFNAGQISEKRSKWTQEKIDDPWLPLKNVKAGEFKPMASEDLYCCSPDGNLMNE